MLKLITILLLGICCFMPTYADIHLDRYCKSNFGYFEAISNEAYKECYSSKLIANIGPSKIFKIPSEETPLVELQVRGNEVLKANLLEFDFTKKYKIGQSYIKSDGVIIPHLYFEKKTKQPATHTVLIRTPYINSYLSAYLSMLSIFMDKNANIVVQPARGTFLSHGKFTGFDTENDIKDGKGIINWVTEKFGKDHKIVVYGGSYDGYMGLTTIASQSPNITLAILDSPAGGNPDTFANLQYREFYSNGYDTDSRLSEWEIYYNLSLDNSAKDMNINKYQIAYERLLRLVNNTTIPVLITYGESKDQASGESVETYHSLRTPKALYIHSRGHCEATDQILSFFDSSFVFSSASLEGRLDRLFTGKNQAINIFQGKLYTGNWRESISKIYPLAPVTIDKDEKYPGFTIAKDDNLYGNFDIEFTVSDSDSDSDSDEEVRKQTPARISIAMVKTSYYGSKIVNHRVLNGHFLYFDLSPEKQQYFVRGNVNREVKIDGEVIIIVEKFENGKWVNMDIKEGTFIVNKLAVD